MSFQCLDVAPLIAKLAPGSATAAYKSEFLFHRPVALDLRMSMTLDMRGDRGSPTRTTCRMNAYSTDTGITAHLQPMAPSGEALAPPADGWLKFGGAFPLPRVRRMALGDGPKRRESVILRTFRSGVEARSSKVICTGPVPSQGKTTPM